MDISRPLRSTIVTLLPNRRIAWKSRAGARNAGAVLFAPTDDGTLVTLKLVYEPEGATETVGDALGVVRHKVEEALRSFKDFIEERQRATGAWRGEIHGGDPSPTSRTSGTTGTLGTDPDLKL